MKNPMVNASIPLYIAAKICSKKGCCEGIWLTLPVTKEYFCEAAGLVCDSWEDIEIFAYDTTVPGLLVSRLMDTPFAVVNHLAARLNKLSDEQILKLTAIMSEFIRFETVEQIIDYTYSPDRYTLIPGLSTHWELGQHCIAEMELTGLPPVVMECIDKDTFGRKIACNEDGWFTSLGYISSKDGWEKAAKKRRVPANLAVKHENGDDLYGAWHYDDWPEAYNPDEEMEYGDDD